MRLKPSAQTPPRLFSEGWTMLTESSGFPLRPKWPWSSHLFQSHLSLWKYFELIFYMHLIHLLLCNDRGLTCANCRNGNRGSHCGFAEFQDFLHGGSNISSIIRPNHLRNVLAWKFPSACQYHSIMFLITWKHYTITHLILWDWADTHTV